MVPITMVPMVPAPGVPSVFTPVPVHAQQPQAQMGAQLDL